MEIRTEKRVMEVEDKIYIAEDGKEFLTEADCRKHEEALEEKKIQAEAEKLELKEIDLYPLDIDAQYVSDGHGFAWYKVSNEEEFEIIARAYNSYDDWGTLKSYPEVVCVEYEPYFREDAWLHILSDMRESTVYFWKKHGFDVEFKEV